MIGYGVFLAVALSMLAGVGAWVRADQSHGPLCGDCSDDMGDVLDGWLDAVQLASVGVEVVPCVRCGKGVQ